MFDYQAMYLYKMNIQLNVQPCIEQRCEQWYGMWCSCGLAAEPLAIWLTEGQKCNDSVREKWMFIDLLLVFNVGDVLQQFNKNASLLNQKTFDQHRYLGRRHIVSSFARMTMVLILQYQDF